MEEGLAPDRTNRENILVQDGDNIVDTIGRAYDLSNKRDTLPFTGCIYLRTGQEGGSANNARERDLSKAIGCNFKGYVASVR
jgi:hypothetical protein